MRRRLVLLFVLLAAVAGCGGGSAADPFAYDEGQSLDVRRETHVPVNDQVVVQELTYASGDDRVEGYLVSPRARSARLPAVVFLHGAGGDREEQLGFAAELAERGAVALTLTVPSRKKSPPADAAPKDLLRWQRDTVVDDVIATRRAFDVLADDDRVDATRLGLVGWSMGARLAAIVADVDDRAKATVLMSVGAVPVHEYVDAAPDQLKDDVQEVLPAIDPLTHVRTIRGALLVQAGRFDAIVPPRALRAMAEAAPDGSRVSWYPADHALNDQAYAERLDWLSARLDVGV
jgi:dienelactone hydrolase